MRVLLPVANEVIRAHQGHGAGLHRGGGMDLMTVARSSYQFIVH